MECKRVFILGAGFSKAAGLPLATELIKPLAEQARLDPRREDDDAAEWFCDFSTRIARMEGIPWEKVNYEQLFDLARQEIELWRMNQHISPWNDAKTIESALVRLERSLVEVVFKHQQNASLDRVRPFVKHLSPGSDVVITFNYDTLVERALSELTIPWNHGLDDRVTNSAVEVLKMHGSIDWIQLERDTPPRNGFTKLFSKTDSNAESTTNPPDGFELWRADTNDAIHEAIENYNGLSDRTILLGVTGLGAHKPLHELPGSGAVWDRARQWLHDAKQIIVCGFSLSPYDAMSRLFFGSLMGLRGEPIECVRLIDPVAASLAPHFIQIFGPKITLDCRKAEAVNWNELVV